MKIAKNRNNIEMPDCDSRAPRQDLLFEAAVIGSFRCIIARELAIFTDPMTLKDETQIARLYLKDYFNLNQGDGVTNTRHEFAAQMSLERYRRFEHYS